MYFWTQNTFLTTISKILYKIFENLTQLKNASSANAGKTDHANGYLGKDWLRKTLVVKYIQINYLINLIIFMNLLKMSHSSLKHTTQYKSDRHNEKLFYQN